MTAKPRRLAVALVALAALAACDDSPLDFDMRGRMGGSVDTSAAALGAVAPRPQPDDRGVISYPNYQVAVARRGDTVASLAQRIGADAGAVARYNGLMPDDELRFGEVVALPSRVAEPAGGPIRAPEDVTAIAGAALDRIQAPSVQTSSLEPAPAAAAQTGVEPTRHQVKRGETAYTIARSYNVSVRSLADWNGLGSDFAVREGQFLLIPVVVAGEEPAESAPITAPGEGSPTPVPPSASAPLPAERPAPAAAPVATPPAPDIGKQSAPKTQAAMSMPVSGSIIREYSQGKNDGLDIAVPAGTAVKAATEGTVGAITQDSSTGSSIVVLKHSDGLLTVYMNVTDVKVAKNDRVSRGSTIASVAEGSPSYLRFGVYQGNKAVDPAPYLAP
nr:LysM peptidoglycan-binding domain-containing protein [Mesobacterium pallidum]